MAVDLEAIARRGRCDASSLKLALPLIEQGYEAPFLARYRRDELGGLDEATLWGLKAALDAEQSLADYRDELHQMWQSTPLADPAIGDAIRKSGSNRTLQRLAKRLRQETTTGIDSDANRLAVRMLNPQKGDPPDAASVAETMESVSDAAAAVEGLEKAIPDRLAGDPRVISAAVRWLSRNAKIHISDVHDPHIAAAEQNQAAAEAKEAQADSPKPEETKPEETKASEPEATKTDANNPESTPEAGAEQEGSNAATATAESAESTVEPQASVAETPAESEEKAVEPEQAAAESPDSAGGDATEAAPEAAPPEATSQPSGDAADAQPADGDQPEAKADGESDAASADADLPGFKPDPQEQEKKPAAKKSKGKSAAPKKQKKISPRQRRRRWLVSVLKPLEGKRMPATKLSAFQIVMLGRALRSQVAVCAFEYDAAKLVGEIKRAVIALNPGIESILGDVVMQHEADIREAAEAAWWDELHERASTRLVGVVADHLRRQVNRGPVDAKVVMSIDAVGPKTAATAIVSADGRVLHGEDLPCQLSGNVRGQTVAKMGELIHQHHVDLVIVSNGPARRACLIALGDLIAQSPDHSVRWTIADRSGADTYASSDVANSEMRSTPRRFRAAAWIAFSIMHPAQAYAKVDPLRLRLASFQSELSEDALSISLGHIMSSGASRGGVDSNAAPLGWLQQLPGMNPEVAQSLIARREQQLLRSRQELLTLEGWESNVQSRQAMPFLRVFESDEVLDGTLIHPDDYALAKKLATALEIELPPPAPPGYEAPSYEKLADIAEPKLVDATTPAQPAPVEDFDHAGEKAGEFKIGDDASPGGETESGASQSGAPEAAKPEASEDSAEATDESAASDEVSEIASADGPSEPKPDEPAAAESDSEDTAAASSEATGETPESAGAASEKSESEDPASTTAPAAMPEPVRRPRPERAKIDKCIKEWQVGRHRVNQLVGWLCDPFGETAISNDPPGVLDTMPTLKTLKPGDQVVGVVVGVMSFGVFVELAPDCSGLIHVSRLSDGYVEDLNEAIQVGDVVTAWVTGIDEKRRRVGLSALSPQQEEQLEKERQNRDASGGRGGYRRDNRSGGGPGRGKGRGQGRQGGGRSGGGQAQPGGQPQPAGRGDQARGGGQGGGGQGRGGQGRGGQGRGGQGRGGQGRGGQGRGGQGGRGGRGRDSRKPRQPESYRVVAKPEAKPISDAMQKGDEPLRSFGDLLQFYSKQEETPTAKEPQGKPEKSQPEQQKLEQQKPEPAKSEPAENAPPSPPPQPAAVETTVASEAAGGNAANSPSASSDSAAEKPTEASE
ncbi:S1 RNA-binding domain-containing protein [Rhodopirellula sp. JC639]|uniref:S1 RNA-binding domain-containing protein n=1 Tax=Stieleria mannarensis TaxID=2755585 RepID=UPI001602A514|nr:S1 RNA-binding domain-containing protein [Rhodopirellula sp. JC639]